MNRIILLLIFLSALIQAQSQSKISHKTFDALLKKHVDEAGLVDYQGLKKERNLLTDYLTLLKKTPPQDSWNEQEQLAYWINAYNAFTLDLVLEYYPVKSIKDIGSTIQVPFVNTPWDIKFIEIGGETYDLNNLEHGIIRKQFDEPRIHFALVCAAVSCPKLLNEAYEAASLDAQLTQVARGFLADETKNIFKSEKEAVLSKLFSWYGGDFTKEMSLAEYVSQYSDVQLQKKARIKYMDYDWSLNEQK